MDLQKIKNDILLWDTNFVSISISVFLLYLIIIGVDTFIYQSNQILGFTFDYSSRSIFILSLLAGVGSGTSLLAYFLIIRLLSYFTHYQ